LGIGMLSFCAKICTETAKRSKKGVIFLINKCRY
jgi:hypothetical protein